MRFTKGGGWIRWCLVFLLMALGTCRIRAQGIAYVTGLVSDKTSAPVPNAKVTIISQATGGRWQLKSTIAGLYRSPSLTPGTYNITVTAPGFQQAVTTGVILEAGQSTTVNFTLTVGSVRQRVVVSAAAPLLNTENAGLGQSISYQSVRYLPMFNRSAGILLQLAPTARYTGIDNISFGASRYNIAGSGDSGIYVDGDWIGGARVEVQQMYINPSVESLQEVSVTESQTSAKFGRDVGPPIQLETKSGTDKFHGSLYEYFRNQAMDTYNGFTNIKPPDRQNIFGGTLGGPIIHNKLFFFTNFEAQLNTLPVTTLFTVPTVAMKEGDFIGVTGANGQQVTIYDPATTSINPTTGQVTRTPFPGNMIPSSRFDSVARKVLSYFPNPNRPGFGNNLVGTDTLATADYLGVNRVDWNISNKDRLFGLWLFAFRNSPDYGYSPYKENPLGPGASPSTETGFKERTQVFSLNETHLFSPSFFTENLFEYRPVYVIRIDASVDPSEQYAAKLGIKNYAGELLPQSLGGDLGFPGFSFTGYTQLGVGALQFVQHPLGDYSFDDNSTYLYGKHSIQFGFTVVKSVTAAPNQTYPTGDFSFASGETGLPTNANSGNSIASFLLGQVDFAQTVLGPTEQWNEWYYAPYLQDNWKLTPKLTLDLGLRWDIDAPVYEIHNRGNSFNFHQINPVSGTPGVYTFLGLNGVPDSYYNTEYTRFAPRFGFAWQMVPKTVLRGGYGIYNTGPSLGTNTGAPDAGYTTSATFHSPNGGVSPAFILQDGFPSYQLAGNPSQLTPAFGSVPVGSPPTSSPTFVARNWKMGYVQDFDLSIERELPWHMVIEVATQGALGRDLQVGQNWDEVPPQYWGMSAPYYVHSPFPQFGSVTELKSSKGTTDYYSVYVRLQKRISDGLTLIGNYSYGRTLGFIGGSMYYPQLTRGVGIWSESNGATGVPYQQAVASWVYSLPMGPNRRYLRSGVAARILGNWDISGILSARGGIPFGIRSGVDSLNGNSPLGGFVDLVGNPMSGPRSPSHWFNTAAFAAPKFGQIGNYGVGTLLSPAVAKLNVAIGKDIPINERLKMRFDAEFFNLTNSLQWGLPVTTLNASNFGAITGPGSGGGANAFDPSDSQRVVQLGLRLEW